MRRRDFKVVYIAGLDRSGSTLLASILEKLPDTISVGELHTIWEHGYRDNWRSSDGHSFGDSPFWTEVLERWRDLRPGRTPDEALRCTISTKRRRHLVPIAAACRLPIAEASETLRQYTRDFDALYEAIAATSGRKLVIDSGKIAYHAALLQRPSTLDFRVMHIVRDPRAVAFSRSRHKINANISSDSLTPMVTHSPARVAARWIWQNVLVSTGTDASTPYTRIDYQSLCKAPASQLRSALERLDLDVADAALSFLDSRTFEQTPGVAFSGNSSRFELRETRIKVDDAWQEGLGRRSRLAVDVLTTPFRRLFLDSGD